MAIDDLNNFENTLAANDIYRQLGGAISKTPIDTKTMTPLAGFGTAVAQSFLASALGQWGKENEAKQLATVANVLPQLYADPKNVAVPEGVDAEAFGALKNSALRTEALRKQDYETRAIESLFSRRPDLASKVLGLDEGKSSSTPAVKTVEAPTIESVLAQGRETTNQKIIRLTKEQMDADPSLSRSKAQDAARMQVQGEISANAKSFDEAKEARAKAAELDALVQTARSGMAMAGQTGSDVASKFEKTLAFFGNEDAKKKAEGDTLLNSVVPSVVKAGRWPGALAVQEMEALKQSGPSSSNTVEANAALVDKMEMVSKHLYDYADFLEAYKDQNQGSTAKAGKLWAEYEKAHPLYRDNKLNVDRPSWQEFFMQKQAAKEGLVGSASSAPDMASFISQAKASGMSKEQAREAWSKLNGR